MGCLCGGIGRDDGGVWGWDMGKVGGVFERVRGCEIWGWCMVETT